MKFLGHLKINVSPCEWLDLASTSRKTHAAALKRISASLNSGPYGDYDSIIADPLHPPEPSTFGAIGTLLKEYYNQPPTKLAALLSLRRNDHELNECPYCGHPFSPDTLDHFVPKDHWPEFSILPNNLVPQCRGCAPIKGSRFTCTTAGTRLFLHPIYSDLVSRITFNITVTQTPVSTQFCVDFYVPPGTHPDEIKAITLHVKALKIDERILRYCHAFLKHWKGLARSKHFNLRTAFNARLSERPNAEWHLNWKTAFFVGMLACKGAMDALQNECPVPATPGPAPSLGMKVAF